MTLNHNTFVQTEWFAREEVVKQYTRDWIASTLEKQFSFDYNKLLQQNK